MPENLTKTTIEFDSANFFTDPDGVERVNLTYLINTVEGEQIKRSYLGKELTIADKARLNAIFASLNGEIRTEEGI